MKPLPQTEPLFHHCGAAVVSPLPPLAARLARRLRLPPVLLPGSREPERRSQAGPDPLQEAGIQLRQAREARGIGLRQLAQETRISTAVLEALEIGRAHV